jgi:hypothetical protein
MWAYNQTIFFWSDQIVFSSQSYIFDSRYYSRPSACKCSSRSTAFANFTASRATESPATHTSFALLSSQRRTGSWTTATRCSIWATLFCPRACQHGAIRDFSIFVWVILY